MGLECSVLSLQWLEASGLLVSSRIGERTSSLLTIDIRVLHPLHLRWPRDHLILLSKSSLLRQNAVTELIEAWILLPEACLLWL